MATATSQLHKFTVECSAIFNNGDSLNLNSYVNAIAVKKDFLANIFPLYVLSMQLPDKERLQLIENEFYLSLKIYRITVNELMVTNDVETSSAPDTDKIIVSILLKPFDNSKTYLKEKASDVDDTDSEDVLSSQPMSYVINCVPKEQLQINNSILNACYSNVNMSEALINLISDVYTKSIYFQESINNTRYKSLLIPPGSLVQTLKYLQNNYLIYNNGLNMFFEYDKLYVYDVMDINRNFRNALNINIDSDPKDANQLKYSQNFVDDDDNVQKYLDANPLFVSQQDIGRYKIGNKVIATSYDENFNLVTRMYDDNTNSYDKKTRVLWNLEGNEQFENMHIKTITQISQISFSNFDPTYIEPDTMVTMSGSLLPYINGTYVITGTDAYYSSDDKKTFSNTVVYHLGKIEK